ncbi:ATP-binding protein [Streptomyces sp. NPDC001914]|uniref:ATP-binding protein n=1 Tax=Streptomyces sp. NPDC001914 TaxID=3364623 RepID=UPI0036BB20E8
MDHWDFDLTADSRNALEPGMSCIRHVLDAIHLADDGHDRCRDDVLLVACELLANAHLHTPGATRLGIDFDLDGGRLTVAVTDRATTRPVPRPWRPDTPHGHGLHIIDRLATAWGVTPAPDGKTVWVALSLDAREPREEGNAR